MSKDPTTEAPRPEAFGFLVAICRLPDDGRHPAQRNFANRGKEITRFLSKPSSMTQLGFTGHRSEGARLSGSFLLDVVDRLYARIAATAD